MNTLWNRSLVAAGLLLAISLNAAAQHPPESVQWTHTASAVKSDKGERLYRLEFTGNIAPGYVIYGPDFEANLGPNPTRLRLEAQEGVTANSKLESVGTRAGTDKAFKTPYTYFQGQAKLSQVVAVAPGVTHVAGTLRGQTCYETDGTCALFNVRFDVPLQ